MLIHSAAVLTLLVFLQCSGTSALSDGLHIESPNLKGHPLAQQIPAEEKEMAREDPADELVDIKMEKGEGDEMKMEFKSHGRAHKFTLRESAIRLTDIPLEIIGMDDEEQMKARGLLKDIKLMRDTRYGAHVAVKVDTEDNLKRTVVGGVYSLGDHEFKISPESSSKSRISKRSVEAGTYGTSGAPLQIETKKGNETIIPSPVNGTVELFVIVDYSAWTKLAQNSVSINPVADVMLYIAYMTAMVDSFYANMNNDDVKIRVALAGVLLLINPNSAPNLVEPYKGSFDGKYFIEGDATLDRLSIWLQSGGSSSLPPNDHVMLLTSYDIHKGTSYSNVKGVGYVGGICQYGNSISFIEVWDTIAASAVTAARYLGHSLGADDDGKWDTTAYGCRSGYYIMSTGTYASGADLHNRFKFSCCSQRSFYFHLSTAHVECLNNEMAKPFFGSDIIDEVKYTLPGQKYSADDQCYMAYDTNACYYNNDICGILLCQHPLGNNPYNCIYKYTGAADGTPCGEGMWCFQGECVNATAPPQPDQHCNVLGCYGDEGRCKYGVNIRNPEYLQCYKARNRCDGYADCSCGSDELNCERVCPTYLFQCKNTTVEPFCVYRFYVCDEHPHCGDGSDEENCNRNTTTQPTTTTPGPQPCGESYRFGFSGEITPPGYPDNYPNHAECQWYIRVPYNTLLQFEFIGDATIEYDVISCSYDYLEFESRGKYCGDIVPGTTIQIGRDYENLEFRSDGNINYPGWKLKWTALCPFDEDYQYPVDNCNGRTVNCSEFSQTQCLECYYGTSYCCNHCISLLGNSTNTTTTTTTTAPTTTTTTTTTPTTTTVKPCEDDPSSKKKCNRFKRKCKGNLSVAEEADCVQDCIDLDSKCCASCCSLFNQFC